MNTKSKALSISFSAALACGTILGTAGVASASYIPVAVPAMTQAAEATISISGFAYTISGPVAPGATVTVINNDSVAHTVTGQGSGQSFDSGSIPGGQTGTFTAPNSPGEYNFVCIFHGNMSGTLVVQEGAGSASASAEAPAPAPAEDDSTDAAAGQADNTNAAQQQMGQMPVGGADTGAEEQSGGNLGVLALGGGFILVAAAGGTYMVRKRSQ